MHDALPDLQILARLLGGEVSGGQVLAPGPGHSAADRSLCVKLESNAPDGFLVHSFASDDPLACRDFVREKIGLPAWQPNGQQTQAGAETPAAKPNGGGRRASSELIQRAIIAAAGRGDDDKPKGRLIATHDYPDADGELLYQVLRYDQPKGFSQRRPDGNGGWIPNLDGVRRAPYRLPELLKYPDAAIFVCEGEKDADRVASLGHCATTVASGTWTEGCIKPLAGHDCVILQDKDEPGAKKALKAAEALHGIAKSVRIVLLPDLPHKGDVSDWLNADPRRAEKLVDICFNVPIWTPDSAEKNDPSVGITKDDARKIDADNGDKGDTITPLPFINMHNWDNEDPPSREWAVNDRIPSRQTTLFSGEGAAGKGIVQLHLSAAHALARDWLGTMPEPGPAIFIDAEDDEGELHRRLAAILTHYQTTFSEAIKGGLHLISLVGDDAVLATTTRSGKIEATPRYHQLLEAAGDIKPKMIGIASSADVFAGDENVRPQVQQFIRLLTRIAMVANGAVNLISHPSLSGINSDTGLSGTTQWHNSVRARFYMKSIKPEAGEQPDTDLRDIVFKKNNYGPISASMVLRYQKGLFLPVPGISSLNKAAQEASAQNVFLDLLRRFNSENRNVNDRRGPTYAPALFAREDEAARSGLNSKNLEAAMRGLFKDDKIWNEPYGKPSRPHYRLALKS